MISLAVEASVILGVSPECVSVDRDANGNVKVSIGTLTLKGWMQTGDIPADKVGLIDAWAKQLRERQ